MGSGSFLRWAFAVLGGIGIAAAAGATGACTSGVTPDCSDGGCGYAYDAAPVEGSVEGGGDGPMTDGPPGMAESGPDSGPDQEAPETGMTDADGGSSDATGGPDSSDSGGHDASDASKDAPASG